MSPSTAAPAFPSARLHSEILGLLEVPADHLFTFPEGLMGFPECRRYALVPGAPGVYWLQSLEHPSLTFLLADPFRFVPGYFLEVDIPGVRAQEGLAVLAIVTLPRREGATATVNLQGPVLFHFGDGSARQLVLPQGEWGVRHPIDLAAVPSGA